MLNAKKIVQKIEDCTVTIGERIQELRKKKGYSQEKLATYLNMSRQAIAKWERNVCEPSIDCLISMSELFKVDLDFLIAGKVVDDEKFKNVIHKTEITMLKGTCFLLDKKDIILLISFITAIVAFIGLFVYALLNPIYWNQRYSFIWWYIRFWVSSGTWFRVLNVILVLVIVLSSNAFKKTKKLETIENYLLKVSINLVIIIIVLFRHKYKCVRIRF